jgi:hypothetical protein
MRAIFAASITAFHLAISSLIRAFNLSRLEGRPAKKATATNRHDHGHCKKTVRFRRHGTHDLCSAFLAAVGHIINLSNLHSWGSDT